MHENPFIFVPQCPELYCNANRRTGAKLQKGPHFDKLADSTNFLIIILYIYGIIWDNLLDVFIVSNIIAVLNYGIVA